jgi:HK97 family phage prohead protease
MKTGLKTAPGLVVARSIPFRDNLNLKKTAGVISRFKTVNRKDGIFEAWVSIFGNVDLQGERVLPGYFIKSLGIWVQSQDPIPAIYSHQWENPFAHIGFADPEAVVEDDLGLHVKQAKVDIEKEFAGQVFDLMDARRIREFSFAHDVQDEQRASDGAMDLIEGDLIEFGPTLKGANPDTILAGTKAARDALSRDIAALERFVGVVAPDWKSKAADPEPQTKAYVQIAGSVEQGLQAIQSAVASWANDFFHGDVWWTYVEATFPDHAIAYVELWDDAPGAGRFYSVPYSTDDAGDVTLGDPAEVLIEGNVVPVQPPGPGKAIHARLKSGARNAAKDLERIQSVHDLVVELGADCADTSEEESDDEPKAVHAGTLRARTEADLLVLGVS